MIIDIDENTIAQVKNPALAEYASIYLRIYQDFIAQVRATGIEMEASEDGARSHEITSFLYKNGAIIGNNGHSIYLNAISPSCVACRRGIGTATFFLSLQCHRDCYYCFNPNQQDYEYYKENTRDAIGELKQMQAEGQVVKHIAVTGGEPLLHKGEVVDFFAQARELYPEAYTRLYTCGDYADEEILGRLKDACLDEIRYSIRMHGLEKGHRFIFDRIALGKQYIPNVMVEMPVLPGTLEVMKDVLRELDRLEIFSINLLEFCYPLFNADEYKKRGFKAKKRPFNIPYNYWYAGGVPVAGSEEVCLELVKFAVEERLKIGVHYCSLENKFTGQIYQQNANGHLPGRMILSTRDYFLKSGKVFGEDLPKAVKAFEEGGYQDYQVDQQYDFLEFNLEQTELLRGKGVEVGISYNVLEPRQDGDVLRELKVNLAYPETFDLNRDI